MRGYIVKTYSQGNLLLDSEIIGMFASEQELREIANEKIKEVDGASYVEINKCYYKK